MMIFTGHVGLALIIAYLLRLDPLLVLVGGILPDIDILSFFAGQKWSKAHRKLSHSLLVPIVILILSLFFPILLPVMIGVVIHLFSDLDNWGVPLLYPFTDKHYSIKEIDHSRTFDSPFNYIKFWFKTRGTGFYLEWALLVIGLILTWDYWIGLL